MCVSSHAVPVVFNAFSIFVLIILLNVTLFLTVKKDSLLFAKQLFKPCFPE